ncbi:MAG: VOC family protein [Candidatus Thiodiazotropha sp. (ex Notomyrtea botanica)]|nr:VOC family protein [Candidatus Thiodiazotropha sp. (ex Notomyrtea botanica)]
MKISAARIFVRDIQAAKDFYSQLGLYVEHYDYESGVCIFNTGETKLIIEVVPATAPEDEQILVGRFTGLSFPTNDIQQDYKILRSKGFQFSGVPEHQSWGGWLATLIDPAKNEIQLVQEVA